MCFCPLLIFSKLTGSKIYSNSRASRLLFCLFGFSSSSCINTLLVSCWTTINHILSRTSSSHVWTTRVLRVSWWRGFRCFKISYIMIAFNMETIVSNFSLTWWRLWTTKNVPTLVNQTFLYIHFNIIYSNIYTFCLLTIIRQLLYLLLCWFWCIYICFRICSWSCTSSRLTGSKSNQVTSWSRKEAIISNRSKSWCKSRTISYSTVL